MKEIGYIISQNKIRNLMDGISVIKDSTMLAPNMPYLVVGLEEAKKYSDDFKIWKKKIDNLGYWTFKKTERRTDYDRDLEAFYSRVINNIIYNIKYYYINILTIRYNKIKKLLNMLNSSKTKYIYINNGMIYIYINNYVLGISLKILKYCGIKEDKIISYLHGLSNTTIYTYDAFLSFQIKGFIKDKKYLIPYFMSLQ